MSNRLFIKNIADLFSRNITTVENTISQEKQDYILNVNEEEYINHLSQSVEFDIPTLDWDNVSADSYEKEFTEYGDWGRYREEQYKVKRQVFCYYIPVVGDKNLLYYRQANTFKIGGYAPEGTFKDGCLIIEFIQRGADISTIKSQYEEANREIKASHNRLLYDIEEHHKAIKGHVRTKFNERKQNLLHQINQLSSLGVPIRKSNAPGTFSIPKPQLRKKIEIKKPIVTEKGFKPEPALTDDDYIGILKHIDDCGKNFERMPSTYKGKGEEDLRDHILFVLDPNFEMGSATGETFNKNGKTDIMLNYNGQAVFIAECKYWTGEKGFLETIDQLLGYLTWRNSKASVIMFVKENDFSSIIQKAVEATKKHSNYLGEIGKSNESWFNFRLHLNGDTNREVKLAIQLYHLPKNNI